MEGDLVGSSDALTCTGMTKGIRHAMGPGSADPISLLGRSCTHADWLRGLAAIVHPELATLQRYRVIADPSVATQPIGQGAVLSDEAPMNRGAAPSKASCSPRPGTEAAVAPPLPPADRPLTEVFDELAERAPATAMPRAGSPGTSRRALASDRWCRRLHRAPDCPARTARRRMI
jgi:hypothetical protein